MAEGKYYWLKLKRDFFKRHDIRIVEEMPNGKEYILFYLKLLCESVDHNGELRFSEEIPYNEDMLATITNTNVDIVRSAVKVFISLHMMDILDDGTIYMREVETMIGSAANNDNALRQARYKERKRLEASANVTEVLPERYPSVTKSNESKNKNQIQSKKQNNSRFTPPTLEEVKAYCLERNNNVDAEKFVDYYTANGWVQGKGKPVKDWKACIRTWEKNSFETPKKKQIVPDYMTEQPKKEVKLW